MSDAMTPLSEVAVPKGLVGGPFGSSLVNRDYTLSGVPVIRGANLGFGRHLGGEYVFVSDEKVSKDLARNTAVPGDLIFTQRGTLGQVAVVPENSYAEYVVSQSQMRLRVDHLKASPQYLYYACSTQAFRKQIADNAISTGVPHINLGILNRLAVPLPSLDDQRAIAEVLGAFDDKIAANTKLAAAADELLATMFSRVVGAETEQVLLHDIAEINGSTVKPSPGTEMRYIDIASVGVGTYDYAPTMLWEDAPSRARRRVQKGDTIWSTVRPNRRSHALNLSDDPLLVGSTGLAVLSAREVGWAYLYEIARRPEFTSYLETVAEGSAYPAVRAEKFGEAVVPLASEARRRQFELVAEPLREKLHSLEQENLALAATRDALLPQLMSGKLRVKEAEVAVGPMV